MEVPDYVVRYRGELHRLIALHGRARAMDLIVGGQFRQIGILERSLLITAGLKRDSAVVDVGCGSGRLAYALRHYLTGQYLGTDLLGDALEWAKEIVARPDWRFVETHLPKIPAANSTADLVCFFSVFTHILDEDIVRFLSEARRVLRPNGLIIFSYLDFEVGSHWAVFQSTLNDERPDRVLNRFVSKPAIHCWAKYLDLEVIQLIDGEHPWISLDEAFEYEDGRPAVGTVAFGQSVGILRKA